MKKEKKALKAEANPTVTATEAKAEAKERIIHLDDIQKGILDKFTWTEGWSSRRDWKLFILELPGKAVTFKKKAQVSFFIKGIYWGMQGKVVE